MVFTAVNEVSDSSKPQTSESLLQYKQKST